MGGGGKVLGKGGTQISMKKNKTYTLPYELKK